MLDSRVSIVVALTWVCLASSLPVGDWTRLGVFALGALVAVVLARVPVKSMLLRWVGVGVFALVLGLFAWFEPADYANGGRWIFLGPIQVSTNGIARAMTALCKALIGVTMLSALTESLTLGGLLRGFRALRVPTILVETTALTWRYLFVLRDEMARMIRAQSLRDFRGRWRRATSFGHLAGSLFLRALDRSENVHAAMMTRGYTGNATPALGRMTVTQWGVLMIGVTVAVAIGGSAWL